MNILLFYRLKENPISEIFDNYAFIFLLEFHDFEVLFDLKKKFLLFISRHFPLNLSIWFVHILIIFFLFFLTYKNLKKKSVITLWYMQYTEWRTTMHIIFSLSKLSCNRKQSHPQESEYLKFVLISFVLVYRFCYIIMLLLYFFPNCFCS